MVKIFKKYLNNSKTHGGLAISVLPEPLNAEQQDSAFYEMDEIIKRDSQLNQRSETDFLIEWCAEHQIDIKTYRRWRDKDKIYDKQARRIVAALDKTFKFTTLRCLNIPKNEVGLSKGVGVLSALFNDHDGLLIEGVWQTSEIKKFGKPLQNSYNYLKKSWECYIKLESSDLSPFDEGFQSHIDLDELLSNFVAELLKAELSLYFNSVAPIQLPGEYSNKKVLFICISAIPREREDVAPPDIGMEPNKEKIIWS